jgi:pimeloyl-ACP methyl ester carboxylesterase
MSRVSAVVASLAFTTVCMAAACAGTPSGAQQPDAVYASTPCPQPNVAGVPDLDIPPGVQCGYLTVPENRSKPDGRKIRIFVMRAPAVSATPKPDPIVYLSGGPGGAGSFEVTSMIKKGLNADREVIFADQRGTHHADPLLGCPEVDQYVNDAISVPFTAESTTAGDAAAVQKCRNRLAAAGVDLAAYNTAENSADIADLRVALGIDTWNVYGVSYGSNLALSVLRDHPQGIRSVVLDSVSPPNNNIAEAWWAAPASSFKAIFAACAAQPSCASAYPNLAADFTATVNRLEETPVVVQAKDSSGAPLTVNIDGFPFAYAVIMASERGDASGVPKMITDMARGDASSTVAAMLALQTPPVIVGLAGYGLAFGVFCSEDANLTTEEAALTKARSVLPGFPDGVLRVQPKQGRLFTECPIWNVGKADAAAMAPTVSDVPVLIMEGEFDAATAPEWVNLVTPHLKNSQLVNFPFTGHAVLPKSTCAQSTMIGFLDNPAPPVDHTCAAKTTLTFTTR